jgi:hypothetical protein
MVKKGAKGGDDFRLTFGAFRIVIVEDKQRVAAHNDVAALKDASAAANLLELSFHLGLNVFDFVLEFREPFEWVASHLDDLLVGVSAYFLLDEESARA